MYSISLRMLILCSAVISLLGTYSIAEIRTVTTTIPLRVGVVLGMTGVAQIRAKFIQRGIQLAVDEANASGGVNGRKLEILLEDSQSTPKGSVAAFKKLVDFNKVDAVIGDVWAMLTNPLIPLAETAKIPLISPTVVDRSVEKTNSFFFTLGPRMSSVNSALESFFERLPNISTLSLIYWDDSWGRAYRDEIDQVATRRKIRVLDELSLTDFGSDYRLEVQRACSKKPDALFISTNLDQAARRLSEIKCTPTVLSTTHLPERLYDGSLPYELAQGWYFIDWPTSSEFVSQFNTKFAEPPIDEAHNGYEALRSIVKAAETKSDSLIQGLRQVKYTGVGGVLDFSNGSFVNHAPAILMVVDGRNVKEVKPAQKTRLTIGEE